MGAGIKISNIEWREKFARIGERLRSSIEANQCGSFRLYMKFVAFFVPFFLFSVGAGLIYLAEREVNHIHQQVETRVLERANWTSTELRGELDFDAPGNVLHRLENLVADPAVQCARIRAVPSGVAIASWPQDGNCRSQADAQISGIEIASGIAVLEVGYSLAEVAAARQARKEFAVTAMLIGLLFAVLTSYFGFRFIVGKPLKGLLAAIRQSTDSNQPVTIEHASNDEMGQIIKAYNRMQTAVVDRNLLVREHAAELEILAMHDPLTSIGNRLMFREELEKRLDRNGPREPFALIMIDLDGFKDINDNFGHPVGDKLLEAVADRLASVASSTDVVARLGGDEFAVITPLDAGEAELKEFVDQLIARLSQEYKLEEADVLIAVSVGIAVLPRDGKSPDVATAAADIALYSAKAIGRNKYHYFDDETSQKWRNQTEIKRDLKTAIANDELELHYQPIVDAVTGDPYGFEALVRWNHPEKGMVPPGIFIPLAEESSIILDIGEWVVRTACKEAAGWPDKLIASVNLSARQFMQDDLCEIVERAVAESGMRPENLQLEITETVFLSEAYDAVPKLEKFHSLGCRIALDDFGTGYSSLSQLMLLPIDTLKLDRSFVIKLESNPKAVAITSAVVEMSKKLGMRITAEGIETEQQLKTLAEVGCHNIQGYLIAKPMPLHKLPQFLTQKSHLFKKMSDRHVKQNAA